MVIGKHNKPSRGVFWLIDGQLLAVPYRDEFQYGVAKSGNTYNHKLLWEHVRPPKCKKPFDYYPRGRVELNKKGQPVIYMNPNIDESVTAEIKSKFGLKEEPVIHYNHSKHYRCHLDDCK